MATKRALAGQLSVVAGFDNPRAELEQYPTPPELAAHVIHLADLHNDIAGRTVVDLGTGTGMLALGAALRGPARVIGVEIDRTALTTATTNRKRVGTTTPIHWIQGDGGQVPLRIPEPATVVMNPPFGAQNGAKGADRRFLASAAAIADVSYSVHNRGSKSFIEAFAADNGGAVTHAFEAAFDVDNQYDHHTDERRELATEVYRIEWTSTDD
ncbi:METTL5 family protein [Halalkalirubrum salinum]|uniref:METTL5 family protein n=1 Tax=Halalkalirubrum salinum TaxID=2563889 RepID=UPI0010FB417C|nr:METTL5 family protein [Halalkalirubrum salinum]